MILVQDKIFMRLSTINRGQFWPVVLVCKLGERRCSVGCSSADRQHTEWPASGAEEVSISPKTTALSSPFALRPARLGQPMQSSVGQICTRSALGMRAASHELVAYRKKQGGGERKKVRREGGRGKGRRSRTKQRQPQPADSHPLLVPDARKFVMTY